MKSKNTKSTNTSEPRSREFKPTFNNLLIKPFEEADKIGIIIIPDSAKHPLNQGEVLAVGPSANEGLDITGTTPMERFAVGDIVIFNMHSESRVKVDDEMLFVLAVTEVLLKAPKSAFKNKA